MENQQLTQLIRQELPGILRRDREMREWVLTLTRERYADKGETESRFDRLLDELRRDREENTRKWEESTIRFDRILSALEAQAKKHDQSIGALGARWGLHTEHAFRSALAGILANSFGVEVLNVTEYDDAGEVFGRPDQVELDVIIQNGVLILCEIKASISRSEMYTFVRKIAFYEKHHQRQATRKVVISPMVEERARALATQLGIEVYSYAEDVTP